MPKFGKDLFAMLTAVLHRRGLTWTEATAAMPRAARRNLRRTAKKRFNPALDTFFQFLRAHGLLFCGVNRVEHLVALVERRRRSKRLSKRCLGRNCAFSRGTLQRFTGGETVHLQPILELLEALGVEITISSTRNLAPVK